MSGTLNRRSESGFPWRRMGCQALANPGSRLLFTLILLAIMPQTLKAEEDPYGWQQPRQATGDDALLGLWRFSEGSETADSATRSAPLKLRGSAQFTADGRFGGGLRCHDAGGKDLRSGVEIASRPHLSPSGPFTLELWIKPDAALWQPGIATAWLIDKMYIDYAHANKKNEQMRDYSLALRAARGGAHTLQATLGFGDGIVRFTSHPQQFASNTWTHLAFVYDGAGSGTLFRDGRQIGTQRHPGRGAVMPGSYPLVIGDRVNSSFAGFPGTISEVSLSGSARAYADRSVTLIPSGRCVFQRMEAKPRMTWQVFNNFDHPLSNATLTVAVAGAGRQQSRLPVLPPRTSRSITIKPLPTDLRPGVYPMEAVVKVADNKAVLGRGAATVTLVPRPADGAMPVVMWGRLKIGDEAGFALRRDTGFTHSFGGELVTYPQIWRAGRPVEPADANRVSEYTALLDDALRHGHALFAYPLGPATWLGKTHPEFQRVDRDGQPYPNKRIAANPCGQSPGISNFCYNVGASIARAYGDHPALQAALIHTEVRDYSQFCFHDWDRAACRAATGSDIPDVIHDKYGIHYRTLPNFPSDHIVADDDPLLACFRWFWSRGDGWNQTHSAVHQGLKSSGRQDLWTWYDPAVRTPSVWGSGGDVDVVSHWSYGYPDPIRVAQSTDELFAMAEGRPGQKVMKMVQAIWYRSQTAPKPAPNQSAPATVAPWEQTDGDAPFITIPPDSLRIAFWTTIARPIQGFMMHDWPALADTGERGGYRFTNPETRPALAELIHSVVQPLGPALLKTPDRPADVAFLQSFSSQMLANRYSWGWDDNDDYLTLQYAQLQTRIVYEESVMRDGLDPYKVLVLSQCDVLPRGVADQIHAFQRRGGIVIADEAAAPAVIPDIRLAPFTRTQQADADKAAILARAAALRTELDPFYSRYADSSTPDVVVRTRQYNSTDYLFAVNDRRTFGDYIGHHGLVMEKGQPASATLTLARDAGHVYDLVTGTSVPATTAGGRLQIARNFSPAEGMLLMVTQQPITAVRIGLPPQAAPGSTVEIGIAVVDPHGRAVDAMVPVRVTITAADGTEAEKTGWYGVGPQGLTLPLDLARNDPPGEWRITVKELASGRSATATLNVAR